MARGPGPQGGTTAPPTRWIGATRSNLCVTDAVAGLGGGEFALLLPERGDDATRGLVGRSREALPEAINRNQSPVGFSVAVRVCAAAPPDIDIMINTADQLMYGARTSATNSTRSSLSAG